MPTPKMSIGKIDEVKNLLDKGLTDREIAKAVGVSKGTVYNIKKGSPNEKPDPTNKRIHELEGRLHKTQDEIRDLRARLKASQKESIDFQSVIETISSRVQPLPRTRPPVARRRTNKIHEDAVLVLSDGHFDSVVQPGRVNNLEEYNFPIACRRMEILVESLVKFTQQTLSNYQFDRLWVFSLGDWTNGEIHEAEQYSYFGNVVDSSLAAGNLIGVAVGELAQFFGSVEVVCIGGNHGRRSKKKDYAAPDKNWDYLIHHIAKLRCRNIKHVSFTIPKAYSTVVNVNGHNFHLSHGDDVRSVLGIPFYGIQRKTNRLIALSHVTGVKIDAVVMGHFHTASSLALTAVQSIINGAFLATDPWTHDFLDAYTKPRQLLFGVHPDRGMTWSLQLDIDAREQPQRYLLEE